MKKIICLIFALLIVVFTALPVYAAKERVIDTADLLTAEEEQKLSQMAQAVYDEYGVDIVILTENTYVSDIQRYAENYYDNGGYSADGIIFYLSMYERDWYMATSGSCIDTLSYSRLGVIFDEISLYLSEDEFYEAFALFIPLCEEYIEEVAFGIAVLVVFLEKKKMNTAVLQKNANDYIIAGSMDIEEQKDVFVTFTVTRVPISQNNGSRGGGVSHGGRGGKF